MSDPELIAEPKSRTRRLVAAGMLVGILAIGLVCLAMTLRFRGETLPSPNGYDDLVGAAREIKGDLKKFADPKLASIDELREIIDQNQAALDRARVGLGRESVVPLARMPSIDAHMGDITALRSLTRLFLCEAIMAEREGRIGVAVEHHADLFRLGQAISSGGTLIDLLAGIAIQTVGVEGMGRVAPALPADDARRLAGEFERLDREREPMSRVFDRDLEFGLDRGGLQTRIAYALNRGTMRGMLAPAKKSSEDADRRDRAHLRLIAVTLAMRAYRLDHPDSPTPPTLDELVPAYLAAVPADPFGKGPLKYHVHDGMGRVYSVGPDGHDDAGILPPSKNSSGGDLMLDSPALEG